MATGYFSILLWPGMHRSLSNGAIGLSQSKAEANGCLRGGARLFFGGGQTPRRLGAVAPRWPPGWGN
jgi:hypothetical protein